MSKSSGIVFILLAAAEGLLSPELQPHMSCFFKEQQGTYLAGCVKGDECKIHATQKHAEDACRGLGKACGGIISAYVQAKGSHTFNWEVRSGREALPSLRDEISFIKTCSGNTAMNTVKAHSAATALEKYKEARLDEQEKAKAGKDQMDKNYDEFGTPRKRVAALPLTALATKRAAEDANSFSSWVSWSLQVLFVLAIAAVAFANSAKGQALKGKGTWMERASAFPLVQQAFDVMGPKSGGEYARVSHTDCPESELSAMAPSTDSAPVSKLEGIDLDAMEEESEPTSAADNSDLLGMSAAAPLIPPSDLLGLDDEDDNGL